MRLPVIAFTCSDARAHKGYRRDPFLDNVMAGLDQIGAWDDPATSTPAISVAYKTANSRSRGLARDHGGKGGLVSHDADLVVTNLDS